MKLTTIGMDIAKNVFHLVELDSHGKQTHRKKLRRAQVIRFFVQHAVCTIAMEGCAGSHYWARELKALGHQVKLLPPQHVKGYLRGQKNDYNDAQGIAEASQRPTMRFVPIKSVTQQDLQNVHRQRERIKKERTAKLRK